MQYIFGRRIRDKLWCYWGIYWVHTKHAIWVLQPEPIAWREIIFLILFITIFGLGFCRFTYLGYLLWFILIILSSCDHFIFIFICSGLFWLAHHWKKLWNFKHPPTQIEVTHFYMVLHGVKRFIFFCIYIYTPHFTYLHLHLLRL